MTTAVDTEPTESELLALRSKFPALSQSVYMISHSLGAMPADTATALQEFAALWVNKSIVAWEDWLAESKRAAGRIERVLGAAPGTVQMATNVSQLQATVASCLDFKGPRNRVVYTELNFPTVSYIWKAEERRGAEVVIVPSDDGIGVPTERLKEFYDTYYHPNNATAVLVGDFDEQTALDLIAKHFGGYPRSPQPIPPMYTTEPQQEGEIRFKLRRSGQLGVVEIGWHIPEARHPDTPVLTVLDHVLSAGVTARLYQALVETQLAVDEHASSSQFIDPGLFTIDATLNQGVAHETVEQAIYAVLDQLRTEDVTDAELAKAKNLILTQMIYLRDSPFGVVNAIGEAEAIADWKFYVDLPKQVEAVTAADIRRVINTYFTEDNRTVGYFIPKEEQL